MKRKGKKQIKEFQVVHNYKKCFKRMWRLADTAWGQLEGQLVSQQE